MSSSDRRALAWLAGLALTAGTVLAGDGALRPGAAFPDLKKAGVEGQVPGMAGKVVLVDFWASWCVPCKSSFPVLDSIYRKFKERGFLVVAVSVDESGDAMREFLGTHPVSFPIVRDARQQLVASAGIEAMPTSFLIDRTGKVVAVHAGFKGRETEEQLMAEIEKQLGESGMIKP